VRAPKKEVDRRSGQVVSKEKQPMEKTWKRVSKWRH